MKKIFLAVFFLSCIITAQSIEKRSLLQLKNQIRNTEFNSKGIYPDEITGKKSPMLAILYSVLLPGMGELYAGSYQNGIYFTAADALFWGAFAGLNIYGSWQRSNYKSFAQAQGSINPDGKSNDYFADIGAYMNIEEFNREKELNREFDKVYDPATHYWKWNSDSQRKEYRNLWSSSETAFNNVRFAVGALIVNRIVSAVNAVRLVSAYNKKLTEEMSWNISVGIRNYPTLPSSLNVNFITEF